MPPPAPKGKKPSDEDYLRDQHWRVMLSSRHPSELRTDMLSAIVNNDSWRFGILMEMPHFWSEQKEYIQAASAHNRVDMLRALTAKNPSWKDDMTPYAIAENAIESGHVDPLRWLVEEHRFDVNMNTTRLLADAAEEGDEPIVDYLLACGARPAANDGYALVLAAREGHLSLVKKFVALGVSVNCDSSAPLKEAINENHTDIVVFLLRQGAEPGEGWHQALMTACRVGSTEIAELLFAKSTNLQHDVDEGLITALNNANYDTADLCLAKGARINTKQGEPLREAVQKRDADTVRYILSHGGNADIAKKNETPLMAAARRGHADMVALLLDRGADYTLYRHGVLRTAAENGERDIMRLVVDFARQRREEVRESKKKEFKNLFPGKYTIDGLRAKRGESGDTGLAIAAQTGKFSTLIRGAAEGNLTAADLYYPAEGVNCVLSHLLKHKSLRQFFEGDLWAGRAEAFAAACDALPETCRRRIDRHKLISEMHMDALRKRPREQKKLKP